MDFKELVAAFAAKYAIEGLDGAGGVAAFAADGVCIELLDDPSAHSMFACAEISEPPLDANGAFSSMMLQANFLLRGTDGATLCQNPETGTYALVRPFPLALTDVDILCAGVESLVNQVENWRKMLAGFRHAEAALPTAAEPGDSHHGMISSGYFHV